MSDPILPKYKSLLSIPFSEDRPLSEIQTQVDTLVSHSIDEATNWKTLGAMTAAGFTSRLLRLGSMTVAAPLLSPRNTWLIQAGSQALALSGESAVFAGMNRGFRNLEGASSPQSFSEEWAQTMINLGSLKIFGGLTKGQNIILQHLTADLGLVAGQNLASAAHLTTKPSGGFIEQMLGAEALNWQMKAGMGLVHGLVPKVVALERSVDLSLNSQEKQFRLKNSPLFSFLSPSPLLATEIGVKGKDLSSQMSGHDPSAPPPSSVGPVFREPNAGEVEMVKREFGEQILSELFGGGKENAARSLATLFINRPELKQMYPAQVFARSDLAERRNLFRRLAAESHEQQGGTDQGRTRVENSLFSQALNLFILFKDHNHRALESLHWNEISQAKDASPTPPPQKGGTGTRDLPPSFLQAHILVGGERLPILTHVRGHYELGRDHFFQDSAVSAKHLLLNFNLGTWFITDGASTYGTYFYDSNKKTWEAYRPGEWAPLHSRDILNIGNSYYQMSVLGGMVHFEPIQLPREIPPNRIRRFTSITFDDRPIRMELESTPRGETGEILIGPFHFRFERGRWSISHNGREGEIKLNGNFLPGAKRAPLRRWDRLEYMGQIYQMQTGADGTSIHLNRVSSWANYTPPPSSNPAADWSSSGFEPFVWENVLNMNKAQTMVIGRMGKKGMVESVHGMEGAYQYSIKGKPWFRSPLWIRVRKDVAHQLFEVTNVGLKEGVWIQDGKGKNLPIAKGRSDWVKSGEKIVFKGYELTIIP